MIALSYAAIGYLYLFKYPSYVASPGYIYKQNILKNSKQPRIIFVGGSNVHYDFLCEQISHELKKKALNYGLIASAGLKFMIESVEPYIESGDIVIISPVYENFYGNLHYGNANLVRTLLAHKDSFSYINSFRQYYNILVNSQELILPRIIENFFHVGLVDFLGNAEKNASGDMGWDSIDLHHSSEFKPQGSLNISYDEFFNYNAISDLVAFNNHLKAKNAKLIYYFPTIPTGYYYASTDKINKVYTEIMKTGIEIMSSPSDSAMASVYFYDTEYHLNPVGRLIRTSFIINSLKKYP